jgi:hypothetical protein
MNKKVHRSGYKQMSEIVLPVLYPVVTPIIAYYTLKYATGIIVDIAINKTKNILWRAVTYPFTNKNTQECIKCKCEKCKQEDCEKMECQQGYELIFTNEESEKAEKLKID